MVMSLAFLAHPVHVHLARVAGSGACSALGMSFNSDIICLRLVRLFC